MRKRFAAAMNFAAPAIPIVLLGTVICSVVSQDSELDQKRRENASEVVSPKVSKENQKSTSWLAMPNSVTKLMGLTGDLRDGLETLKADTQNGFDYNIDTDLVSKGILVFRTNLKSGIKDGTITLYYVAPTLKKDGSWDTPLYGYTPFYPKIGGLNLFLSGDIELKKKHVVFDTDTEKSLARFGQELQKRWLLPGKPDQNAISKTFSLKPANESDKYFCHCETIVCKQI